MQLPLTNRNRIKTWKKKEFRVTRLNTGSYGKNTNGAISLLSFNNVKKKK